MNNYEQRKQAKIERYNELANKAEARSNERYEASKVGQNVIPFGQPILIGHHSERKHRRLIERNNNNMRKSIEESNKSEYYKHKAETLAHSNIISSDDPQAIEKLEKKLASLTKHQEIMKWANKILRSKKTSIKEKQKELLVRLSADIVGVFTKDCEGFRSYELTNNNANIKRIQLRIKKLKELVSTKPQADKQIGDIRVVENIEINRVQVFFPGKPEQEMRTKLKRNGFRWAPSNGCWQSYWKKGKVDIVVEIINN